MQIFDYPYIIITIFVLCFIGLGAVGIYFALRGMKAAEGQVENDFTTISKMEGYFRSLGKQRTDRSVIYVGLSSDDPGALHAESTLFANIKRILLGTLSDGENSAIASYDEQNFVALANWDMETARKKIENCQNELNKCLLAYSTLNIVVIRVGLYFVIGTQVTFGEALNRAKQAYMLANNEKIPYAQWDLTRGNALEKKIQIENNIEREIDNNRFFLEYQPVLDAKTKKIIGAEVLARLNSETDGVLSPGSFLGAVDSVGINEKFDYYIFEKNCKWISNDKKQREGFTYTINFSRSTLSEPNFAEKIIEIAEKYDLKLSCLAVEVLEDRNITGEAQKQMIENLAELKKKGIMILLDDFGIGYAGFGDLQDLDVSIIKIDQSITRNAVTEKGFAILKNMIRTFRDIGLKTLCEGIETEEEEKAVISAGCDLLQGYYYYRPMPVAKLEEVFEKNFKRKRISVNAKKSVQYGKKYPGR